MQKIMAIQHFFLFLAPFNKNLSFFSAHLELIKNAHSKNKSILFQYSIFQTIIALHSLRCTVLKFAPLSEKQRIIACDLIYFFYNEHFNLLAALVFGTFPYIVHLLVNRPNTKNCQLLADIVLKGDDRFFIYKNVSLSGNSNTSICKRLQKKMLLIYNLTQCFLFSFGR